MTKTKIWITGSKGRVGRALRKLAKAKGYSVYTSDKDLDISVVEDVNSYVKVYRPNVIVNCAGITDLTYCEENPYEAFRINAIGARNLAAAAQSIGAKFIQVSTDDVFDGKSPNALNEFEPVNPYTVYGKSKLAGENLVRELTPKHIIVRSSWVYGSAPNCYVSKLLDRAKTESVIQIPNDQFSCPTSAAELSKCILKLIETNEYGVFHASCEGVVSRYQFARKIIEYAGLSDKVTVEPVLATAMDTGIANRSRYTILDNMMLKLTGAYEMPNWEIALAEYMQSIKK
ncbi:MAG: dTDP-4-dehydrorhamnose reductase [Lachnospiraceae bacterium]|nr:dTDP-4-dehydrorhamnose reductase [Lachnospiraceae bacterium]